MAALAYLLLPLSGLVAFLVGSERVRKHGTQAIGLGIVWGAAAYAASWIGALATRSVVLTGGVVWIVLIVATAAGRDLWLPGFRRFHVFLDEGH